MVGGLSTEHATYFTDKLRIEIVNALIENEKSFILRPIEKEVKGTLINVSQV